MRVDAASQRDGGGAEQTPVEGAQVVVRWLLRPSSELDREVGPESFQLAVVVQARPL